jgi:diacylglycerol kinase family enzyme
VRKGLLIFNPKASTVSPRVRDVIAHAFSAEMSLEVAGTKRRHHATHLASGAAHEGFDVVIMLGGDGTLNEVINGLVGTDVPVIPLPGGRTNVFARTYGLPRDPIEATSIVLERLAEQTAPRVINIGRVNGRAFGFCASFGFDAAVVRAVDRRFRVKQKIGEPFFVLQAFNTFGFGYKRRAAPISLEMQDRRIESLKEVVVCSSDPFTFLGERPFRVCPNANSDEGLDVTALTSLRMSHILRVVAGAFRGGRHTRMRTVRALHDLTGFRLVCESPVPYQVDGEFAGEDSEFHLESLPNALRIIT